MDRETHKFNFERYERMEEANAKALDRLLEIIATGTFALSLAFVTGFGPKTLVEPKILIWSWIFFGLAILCQIAGYLYALSGLAWTKERLIKIPIDQPDPRTDEQKATEEKQKDRFVLINQILRCFVLIFMVIGMSLLIWFVSTNLLKKDSQNVLEKEVSKTVVGSCLLKNI